MDIHQTDIDDIWRVENTFASSNGQQIWDLRAEIPEGVGDGDITGKNITLFLA